MVEVVFRAERFAPGKNTGFHNPGEVGMGGKITIQDNAGFRLRFDKRLLAHVVVNADNHNDGGKNKEAADAKIEKHS